MLVDSHCHLDFKDFADELDDVVERARAAGIGCMLTICTRLERLERNLAIVERFPDVYLAVGVHPHEADAEGDVTVDRLVEVASHPKVVGIGETGLDFHYTYSDPKMQEASFRTHIRAARQAGLPFIVHTREADEDTRRILADEGVGDPERPVSGLLHCFSSGSDLADAAVGMGLYVSFSGMLTFNRSEDIRSVARTLPAERLLVETDAPYLAPTPKRGKRNEPAYVAYTAARLARERGMSEPDLHRQTTENFFRLFSKIPAPAHV